MKDTPLSNCERDFLLRAISEKKVGLSQNIYTIVEFMVTWAVDNLPRNIHYIKYCSDQ